MSRTVRTNLAGKLASGAIKGRPGMHGHDRPEREPVEAGIMGTPEAVRRVPEWMAAHRELSFYEAFREVMEQMERGE